MNRNVWPLLPCTESLGWASSFCAEITWDARARSFKAAVPSRLSHAWGAMCSIAEGDVPITGPRNKTSSTSRWTGPAGGAPASWSAKGNGGRRPRRGPQRNTARSREVCEITRGRVVGRRRPGSREGRRRLGLRRAGLRRGRESRRPPPFSMGLEREGDGSKRFFTYFYLAVADHVI
jgi:hypothetical protein